jgi:hypothetical protein
MPQVLEAIEAVSVRAFDIDIKHDEAGNVAGG